MIQFRRFRERHLKGVLDLRAPPGAAAP
jgi:hypothetical protein